MPAASTPVTPNSKNPLRGAVEIIPDKLYFCALKSMPSTNKAVLRNKKNKKCHVHLLNIDEELVYWNFFLDFGPLNLGQLYRFSSRLNYMLETINGRAATSLSTTTTTTTKSKSNSKNKDNKDDRDGSSSSSTRPEEMILFFSSTAPAKRANAIFLICAWQLLHMGRSPEDAWYGFNAANVGRTIMGDDDGGGGGGGNGSSSSSSSSRNKSSLSRSSSVPPPYPLTSVGQATMATLPPFHDASPCACTYELTLLHCLYGLQKARRMKFFDWDNFDVEEYEHFEQVENGDLNWIIQDKILAFAGPSFKKTVSPEGYCTLSPAEYIPYFQKKKVGLVVRLNKKMYEEQDFIDAGIDHLEQFYLDGSCPPMKILQKVIAAFEAVPRDKAFAVHCKAGLGRTGTCIGAYIMKHYRFTASEVIAWMRICRPGMVIGPQQHFLQDLEHTMWQEGDLMRGKIATPIREKKSSSGSRSKRTPSSNGKASKSTVSSSSALPKAPSMTDEAVTGRQGQAEGLLAARQRPKTTGGTMGPISPENHAKPKAKPVPVTPDSSSKGIKAPPMAGFEEDSSSQDEYDDDAHDVELSGPHWVQS